MLAQKKGQMLAQPFIYIFALILGALILVWGVKTIIDLREKAQLVEVGKFVKELEAEAKEFYNYEEGATKEISVVLPEKLNYMCLFDAESYKGGECKKKLKDGRLQDCVVSSLDPNMGVTLQKDKKNNLFFVPFSAAKLSKGKFSIPYLKPASPLLCYTKGSKITITSKVRYVEAS